MSSMVMTVLGPVEASDLGVTLPHEHLFVDLFKIDRNIATLFDELERMVFEASAW